jgi:8-oxo-dGTP diphosphatase
LTRKTILVVAVALIDGSGKVLVQQRPAGKPMAGLWEFPGGKVEDGELMEHALARELHEELDIIVDPKDLKSACFASEPLDAAHLLLLLFTCRVWRGVASPKEAPALRWLHLAELRELPMPPADGPLIDLLERLI